MRLLDLTRSLRRAGRVATGVDRVERAYLNQLLKEDVPLFGLLRTGYGYVMLDRAGIEGFRERLEGKQAWGPADILSKLPRGRTAVLRQAEADVRRLAIARAVPWRLTRLLARFFPKGVSYVNVGHSNLTDRVLGAVKALQGGRIAAMIHDVIPLEYPQYQRPGTVAPFAAKIARLRNSADLLIYNSEDTRMRAEAQMQSPALPAIVSHLGITLEQPNPLELPGGGLPKRPYFVCVGTIEPRKNHAFLLDLWETLGADAPHLYICGARGWNNGAVFDRLDALPADGPVKELGGLGDAALAALVEGAQAALFPSHAEGFGLPAAEALTLGTRVLCNNLPVFREFLAEKPIYADVSDGYLWKTKINELAQVPTKQREILRYPLPSWDDHFNIVLRLI